MPTFNDVFAFHGALAFDRQLHLMDQIGDWMFQMDAQGGLIHFTKGGLKKTAPMQVLGTEVTAKGANAWVWAWAPEMGPIPAAQTHMAQMVRARGASEQIAELVQPHLKLGPVDGHRLSMIASSMLNAPGYYRGPFEGGAVFVLINDPAWKKKEERPAQRIANTFQRFLTNFPIAEQRRAFEGHCKGYGLTAEKIGNDLQAKDAKGDKVVAEFDRAGKLTKVYVK
jgi:hypothetical protein